MPQPTLTVDERIARQPIMAREIMAAAASAGLTCTAQEASIAAGSYLEFGRNDPENFGLGFCSNLRPNVAAGALAALRAWVAAQDVAVAA